MKDKAMYHRVENALNYFEQHSVNAHQRQLIYRRELTEGFTDAAAYDKALYEKEAHKRDLISFWFLTKVRTGELQ